jgi:hypothetical protein
VVEGVTDRSMNLRGAAQGIGILNGVTEIVGMA